jgi:hypothetical protein
LRDVGFPSRDQDARYRRMGMTELRGFANSDPVAKVYWLVALHNEEATKAEQLLEQLKVQGSIFAGHEAARFSVIFQQALKPESQKNNPASLPRCDSN